MSVRKCASQTLCTLAAFIPVKPYIRTPQSVSSARGLQNVRLRFVCPTKPRASRRSSTISSSVPTPSAPAWHIWGILLGSASLGLSSKSTKLGSALSPPVVTTLLTLLLSNAGILPASHVAYTHVSTVLVPLAVPLLLFAADFRRVLSETGRLLPAFVLGSLATAVATLCAFRVVNLTPALGPDAWKIATALCARHIGGAVNYVAVIDAIHAHPAHVAAALAADNLVLTAYFVLLFALARGVAQPVRRGSGRGSRQPRKVCFVCSEDAEVDVEGAGTGNGNGNSVEQTGKHQALATTSTSELSPTTAPMSMDEAGISLTLSAALCAIAVAISRQLPFSLGAIPVITLVSLCFTNIFPKFFSRYQSTANAIGVYLMQVFFAATGAASGRIVNVIASAPMLFIFILVQLSIHASILFVFGRLVLRFHKAELLLASNANVGGPSTAAAMATAKAWSTLIVPALLVGVFGYSIATFVALAIGHAFLKPIMISRLVPVP